MWELNYWKEREIFSLDTMQYLNVDTFRIILMYVHLTQNSPRILGFILNFF